MSDIIIDDNIFIPSNPENRLVNYELKLFGKKVLLGAVGNTDDWAEIILSTKEKLEQEWNNIA